ncbi:Unknown protein, partial [Striga hermonthica]
AVRWVAEGEQNTKFFQGFVRQKRAKSYIHSIEVDGSSLTQESQVRESAVIHLQTLFTSDRVSLVAPTASFFPNIPPSVDLVGLCELPNREEVRDAVFGIDPNSDSGPNGFSSLLYQVSLSTSHLPFTSVHRLTMPPATVAAPALTVPDQLPTSDPISSSLEHSPPKSALAASISLPPEPDLRPTSFRPIDEVCHPRALFPESFEAIEPVGPSSSSSPQQSQDPAPSGHLSSPLSVVGKIGSEVHIGSLPISICQVHLSPVKNNPSLPASSIGGANPIPQLRRHVDGPLFSPQLTDLADGAEKNCLGPYPGPPPGPTISLRPTYLPTHSAPSVQYNSRPSNGPNGPGIA